MKTITKTTLYIATLLLLASCVKVEYDKEDVISEDLILITNWDDRSEGINVPENYILRINGEEQVLQGNTNVLNLDNGDYKFILYNMSNKVEVAGDIAKVETTDDFVNNKPGWFFTSRLDINIVNNVRGRKVAYMMQEVRQLKIILTEKNGNIAAITHVESTLDGVANEMNITTRKKIGNPVNVGLPYERTDDKMISTIRLLGIYPTATQKLITTITANGVTKTIETDLTDLLKNFNEDKSTPLTLSANLDLEITGTEPGFSATIKDWEEISENIIVD